MESLQKTGVLAVMNKEFRLLNQHNEFFYNNEQLISTINREQDIAVVRYSLDINGASEYSLVEYEKQKDDGAMCLTFIPMQGINFQATLAEVYSLLEVNRHGAVYVFSTTAEEIVGVITWKTLRYHLHKASY
jgi:hypothetical protein